MIMQKLGDRRLLARFLCSFNRFVLARLASKEWFSIRLDLLLLFGSKITRILDWLQDPDHILSPSGGSAHDVRNNPLKRVIMTGTVCLRRLSSGGTPCRGQRGKSLFVLPQNGQGRSPHLGHAHAELWSPALSSVFPEPGSWEILWQLGNSPSATLQQETYIALPSPRTAFVFTHSGLLLTFPITCARRLLAAVRSTS